MNINMPKLIGLVGNPGAGKSTAQKILQEIFEYEPIDDGYPLRQFAVNNLGLSWKDVSTQEGKSKYTEILGVNWQNRDILGTLGLKLENMFGENIIPWMALKNCDENKKYCFGSVRKNQGLFIKDHGGIVLEIRNPDSPESIYEFDKYNKNCIDAVVINDGLHNGMNNEDAYALLGNRLISVINQFTW